MLHDARLYANREATGAAGVRGELSDFSASHYKRITQGVTLCT